MKPADFVLLGIIILLFVFAVAFIVSSRKKGKCIGCGGNCENCKKCDDK